MHFVAYLLAVYACIVLKLPTGSLHFGAQLPEWLMV